MTGLTPMGRKRPKQYPRTSNQRYALFAGTGKHHTYAKLALITAWMHNHNFTIRQLRRQFKISETSARNWTYALREAKLLHITDYCKLHANGEPAAVWTWGPGIDAKKPPMTPESFKAKIRRLAREAREEEAQQSVRSPGDLSVV